VTLFPEESCSCGAVSHCSHRTADKMMLGIPHSAANTSLNAAALLRHKRREIGRKTGRKQPKRGEVDGTMTDDCSIASDCTSDVSADVVLAAILDKHLPVTVND